MLNGCFSRSEPARNCHSSPFCYRKKRIDNPLPGNKRDRRQETFCHRPGFPHRPFMAKCKRFISFPGSDDTDFVCDSILPLGYDAYHFPGKIRRSKDPVFDTLAFLHRTQYLPGTHHFARRTDGLEEPFSITIQAGYFNSLLHEMTGQFSYFFQRTLYTIINRPDQTGPQLHRKRHSRTVYWRNARNRRI